MNNYKSREELQKGHMKDRRVVSSMYVKLAKQGPKKMGKILVFVLNEEEILTTR